MQRCVGYARQVAEAFEAGGQPTGMDERPPCRGRGEQPVPAPAPCAPPDLAAAWRAYDRELDKALKDLAAACRPEFSSVG